MTDRPYNVLFLCTGNSARSILAEGILKKDGGSRFNAFSAGSHPGGAVNPFALRILESYGYPTDGLHSKSWDVFTGPDAPQMDFIFTVCDNAKGESCPVWLGYPASAHWGIDDPSHVDGTDIEKEAAFVTAFNHMKNRIAAFIALPIASLDAMALAERLGDIGALKGATDIARKSQSIPG